MFGFLNKKNIEKIDKKQYTLNKAIESKNANNIKSCINNGTSQDSMYHSMTLLYYVVLYMNNNIELIEFLLQKGASITKKNDTIDNISREQLNNVLIKAYEIHEITERYDKTPLDLVVETNNIRLIKLFIKYNPTNKILYNWFIDNKIQDKELLSILIEHNKSNYLFLKKLSDLNPTNLILSNILATAYYLDHDFLIQGQKPLYWAIKNNDIDKTRKLLEYGADKNLYNLKLSVEIGNLEIIKLLIKHDADVHTLLCIAIEKDKYDIISFLIKQSIDLNKKCKFGYPLVHAVHRENIHIVELLLKNNANPNFFNSLTLACMKQNLKMLKLLIEHKADVDFIGSNGNTPLYFAVSYDNFEMSELLLKNNANPNVNSILHKACEKQNLKMVKLLTEYKADVNFADNNGRTPLFTAIEAKKANKEIIRFLIANGADIHKEDKNGISALSFAESNKVSLVKVLTEHEEVKLSENQDPSIVTNYQKLLDKIVLQNKVINKLKDEVQAIKKSDTDNQIVEDYKLQIDDFKETILSQSNEIKELQNKLIIKEQDTKELMNNFMFTMNKLEEKIAKQKVVKTKIPLNIPTEKQSIKKDDGVIVKRESFDDF